AALDACGRNRRDVLVRVEQQADVDELVWIEKPVFVRKLCAQLDRSGGRIDLAVEALQRSVRDLGRAGAIKRSRGQDRAGLGALGNCLKVVLGHGEQDADRLQLR